jgi:hypothetical protein
LGWALPANWQCCAGKTGGHRPKEIAGENRVRLSGRTKGFVLRGFVAELAEGRLRVYSSTPDGPSKNMVSKSSSYSLLELEERIAIVHPLAGGVLEVMRPVANHGHWW